MPRTLITLLLVTSLLGASGRTASAFLPSTDEEAEIPGPYQWTPPRSPEIRSGEGMEPALDAFQARYGGDWRMTRSLVSNPAFEIYGTGIPLAPDGEVADAAEAAALARAFIDEHVELFGVASASLALAEAAFGLGKWGVTFHQVLEGIRVERSKVTLLLNGNGRLYAFMAETYPEATVPTVLAVSRESAVATAKSALGFHAVRDAERDVAMALVPILEESRAVVRLAYKIDLATATPFGLWSTYVDAISGDVLWRENNYETFVANSPLHLSPTITGSVTGEFPQFNPCDGIQVGPFRNQRAREVVGGSAVATDTLAGAFALTVADTAPENVAFELIGMTPQDFARVINMNGPEAADTVLATPGVPVDFVWDDTNARLDERSAWVHGNRAHDFIKGLDPTFTGMDYEVLFIVNNTPGQANCPGNAIWDGTNAHFCAASGSDNNTGEIADVVYHEYGHGVGQKAYAGNFFTNAMSEGNADVFANFINEDPVIGDGYFTGNCGVGIRNSNNAYTIQDTTIIPGSHLRGQIIAGFWWGVRGRLIESHDEILKSASPNNAGKSLAHELWHWCRRLAKPRDETGMVSSTFFIDDDDANILNGTPNRDDLCAIAMQKGFTCPSITEGVSINHVPLASTTDTTSAREVVVTPQIIAGTLNPNSVALRYRVNGGSFVEVAMTPGGGGTFGAFIPAQPQPSVVDYYITAQDAFGFVRFYSPTAAQDATPDTSDLAVPPMYPAFHTYDVCLVYDPCESVGEWVAHAAGSTAMGGSWENGVAVANTSQPLYDMTPAPGTRCFVTGASNGNVDGGTTILLSPVWDLTARDSVVVKFRRWFVNDQAGNGNHYREDEFTIDTSNDSGATWTNLETTNEGVDSWQERAFDLSTLFGQTGHVQLRFTARDTGQVSVVEALVDEVRITGRPQDPVDVPAVDGVLAGAVPARFALHANEPNPFNPATVIRFDLPRATTMALTIYNTSGQRIRTLASGRRPPGRYSAVWNGLDERGQAVSSGVYLYRLETPEFDETRKALLVK